MIKELALAPSKSRGLEYYSDKAILPASILENLLSQFSNDDLPSVLIFKIKGKAIDKSYLIGVLEFTADENTIILPGVIQEHLKLQDDSSVSIEFMRDIQKGTSLNLKSLQKIDIGNILNMKFFLEANLPNSYTTISKGETLSVRNMIGGSEEVLRFEVIDTKPQDHICIINTSLDFDLQPLDTDDAMKIKEYTRKKQKKAISSLDELKNNANSNIQVLDISNDKTGINISISESKLYEIPINDVSNSANKSLQFRIKCISNAENLDECDLLISTDKFIDSKTFIWSTINSPESSQGFKELIIPFNEPLLTNINSLFFGIHMWDSSKKFVDINLDVSILGENDASNLANAVSLESDLNENEILCPNCGRAIQKSSSYLHENFCLRNNVRCQLGCNQIFLKRIPESHWHCNKCSFLVFGDGDESLKKHNIFNHQLNEEGKSRVEEALYRSTIWENKLHECRFCHLILPKGKSTPEDRILNLSHHENSICGNKTIECPKCSKIISLKNAETHMKLHELDKMIKRKNINYFNCSNINCSNVIDGNIIDNDILSQSLKLCDTCFSQLHSTLYDPGHKKLVSRIERKYVIQLTRGCGKSFCKNSKCISSGIFSKRPTLKETLEYIKSDLMRYLPSKVFPSLPNQYNQVKFWFCVNESITKRKLLADYLYEEFFSTAYAYYWVCLAVLNLQQDHYESNSNDEYFLKVKSWLINNAYSIEESK